MLGGKSTGKGAMRKCRSASEKWPKLTRKTYPENKAMPSGVCSGQISEQGELGDG